jgi:hypothetical protein
MADNTLKYQVRLRHVNGDLGPFTLPGQTTMLELGELACSQWPEGKPYFMCWLLLYLYSKPYVQGRNLEN